jgi:hypothetical protein
MKYVINALKRSIEEAENNGHRSIIFPTPDAKTLVNGFEDMLLKFTEFSNREESHKIPRIIVIKQFLKNYFK